MNQLLIKPEHVISSLLDRIRQLEYELALRDAYINASGVHDGDRESPDPEG